MLMMEVLESGIRIQIIQETLLFHLYFSVKSEFSNHATHIFLLKSFRRVF